MSIFRGFFQVFYFTFICLDILFHLAQMCMPWGSNFSLNSVNISLPLDTFQFYCISDRVTIASCIIKGATLIKTVNFYKSDHTYLLLVLNGISHNPISQLQIIHRRQFSLIQMCSKGTCSMTKSKYGMETKRYLSSPGKLTLKPRCGNIY